MSSSTGKLLGKDLEMMIDGKVYVCLRSGEVDQNTDVLEKANENSGDWKSFDPTFLGWRVSSSYWYVETQQNYSELWSLWRNKAKFEVQIRQINQEGFFWFGQAFISNLSLSWATDQGVGFRMSMQGDTELEMDEFRNLWADPETGGDAVLVDENGHIILI